MLNSAQQNGKKKGYASVFYWRECLIENDINNLFTYKF